MNDRQRGNRDKEKKQDGEKETDSKSIEIDRQTD